MRRKIKGKRNFGILSILVTVVVGLMTLYAQLRDPMTGIIIFAILLGAILVHFVVSYFIDMIKEKLNQINENSRNIEIIRKDLNIIKDKLDFKKDMEGLNIRLSVLEKMSK